MTTLSIIVCTYNRCDKLESALASIAAARIPEGLDVELIVVDNNSRDRTRDTVAAFAPTTGLPVRYVFEAAQGQCFARNRGIREARGRILANTDDDCIVDREWLAALWREFADHSEIGVAGGRVDLYDADDKPVSIRPWPDRVHCTDGRQINRLIMGANMAFRREVVERIGGFDPALGGTKRVTADDVDFIYRALRAGFGVAYVPDIRVRHDHGRRGDDEIASLNRSYVRGRGALYCKHMLKGDRHMARHAFWEVAGALKNERNIRNALAHWAALGGGALHLILARARLVRY